MPEDEAQGAPAEQQDTPQPDVEAPETEGDAQRSEEVDWSVEGPRYKQRYDDVRPELDRTRQQKSQLENLVANLGDEELGPQLLPEVAPYLYKEEEDDDSEDDPYLTREEFQQTLQQQQDAQTWQAVQGHVGQLVEKEGLDLTDRQKNTLAREAYEAGATPDKTEELSKEFFAELSQFGDKYLERYRESKRGPQAPGGTAAVKQEDLDTREGREAAIARRIADIDAAYERQ